MGINTSRLKGRKLIIQSLPENVQTKSDKVIQPSCFLSNDVEYVGNIHAFHFIKKNLFQSNFSSPIEERLIQSGYKVLDVGCGSGTWLLDMSTNYEMTRFLGLDFQSIYPQE
ncbi:5529_t:CDS:2, partial [Funneliformis mosseae]